MPTAERFRLPPVLTASTWGNLWGAAWERAKQARGVATADDGTVAPVMTNREALALIAALRVVAAMTSEGFPLWYQFAAVAYGWNPTTDTFDVSQKQADRLYPADDATELQLAMQRLTTALDRERSDVDARLELDDNGFFDILVQGDVRRALLEDGATVAFKIPVPSCKDPKTGRPTGKPQRDPKTGKWTCEPVLVDDPVTAVGKPLTRLIVFAGVVAGIVLITRSARRRRARRRR